ncbi:MAG: HD domain-containing phosphohydrolase [Haliangium ochraceum]
MEPKIRTRILCVDDEPNVLSGLSLNLGRKYDVLTAGGGTAGLEILEKDATVAVIISDMRMPGMDGAAFLSRARVLCPDSVRLLLTGQSDLDSAVSAVNEGQIFRFLTKPCPLPTLLAAVEGAVGQNRLLTSERVLLEQTLHGSIKALTDILSLTNPVSFGRATRIKQQVVALAAKLDMPERWQVEVAAMLSQLGCVTLPSETVEKMYFGRPVTPEEQKMIARVPAVTEQLLGNIPRLEVVQGILSSYSKPYRPLPATEVDPVKKLIDRGAQVLRVAVDFDVLEAQGSSDSLAVDTIRGRADRYDPEVIRALVAVKAGTGARATVREIPLTALRVGMVCADDVKMLTGTLLVTRGYEVTPSFLERIRNFRGGTVKEPLRVIVPKD